MNRVNGMLLGVVLMGLAAGCGTPAPDAGAETQEPNQSTEARTLSPEELQELLDRASQPDPEMMQAMATCQPSNVNSCVNAGYGSCANWSAWSFCGSGAACSTTQCSARFCYFDPEIRKYICEPAGYSYSETQNRYRVCYNSTGQTCTEFELYSYTGCDC